MGHSPPFSSAPLQADGTDIALTAARVREAFGLLPVQDRLIWEWSGADALSFLQNRLSNDVSGLAVGQGQLNAALDRQGKIQGLFALYRVTDDAVGQPRFWMLVDAAQSEQALAAIQQFKILEQVSVQPVAPDAPLFWLQGPTVESFLTAQLEGSTEGAEFTTWNLPWGTTEAQWRGIPVWVAWDANQNAYVLLKTDLKTAGVDAQAFLEAAQTAGGQLMTPTLRETLRIEAGEPRFGIEYDPSTLLPETGLASQAVSYTKGCYLGQETVARVKTYGALPQALAGLVFEPGVHLPAPGTPCELAGRVVGRICSGCESPFLGRPIAMAYLGKNERVPGQTLHLTWQGQPVTAQVVLLPFYHPETAAKSKLDEGLRAFAAGNEEEAVQWIRQAIREAPQLVAAYEALGVILSRRGQYEEAIALMRQVLRLEPEHVLAHTNLSVFYMKLGNIEAAESEKAQATLAAFRQRAKESGLTVNVEAQQRQHRQALQEKVEMFQAALAYNPTDALGNFGLGSAYVELEQLEAAIAPLQQAIQSQPKHSMAYLLLGKSLEGSAQPERAMQIYQQGIAVAAAKGDLMPLKDMQRRLEGLQAARESF